MYTFLYFSCDSSGDPFVTLDLGSKIVSLKLDTDVGDDVFSHYRLVTPAHVMDSIGVSVYSPRIHRPNAPLPRGQRELIQWEFDKYISENMKEYPDLSSKTNAAIWNAFLLN